MGEQQKDPAPDPEPYRLKPELEEELRKYTRELPPLTDEQLDRLCDVLVQVRLKAGR